MTESTNRKLPTWDDYYKNEIIEKMPWYNEKLDFDLKEKLNDMQFKKGIFLDLGSGPGTQAVQLAKRGFNVIGSDISETVIKRNKIIYEKKYPNLQFVVDNILHSNFKDNYFDYIFDRGCFHVFAKKDRSIYLNQVKKILKLNGFLFLKCFSIDEPMKNGPYKFSRNDIYDIFSNNFQINHIENTVYQGTLDPLPKALFSVMKLIKKWEILFYYIDIDRKSVNSYLQSILNFILVRNMMSNWVIGQNNIIKQEGIRVIIHLEENDKISSLEYDKQSTEKNKKKNKNKIKKVAF